MQNFKQNKAFWQKYTEDEITDDDVVEIEYNLREFAKVFWLMNKELKAKEKT